MSVHAVLQTEALAERVRANIRFPLVVVLGVPDIGFASSIEVFTVGVLKDEWDVLAVFVPV